MATLQVNNSLDIKKVLEVIYDLVIGLNGPSFVLYETYSSVPPLLFLQFELKLVTDMLSI